MKRQKFQNRDVIHIHNLLWITMSIAKLITKNYIRIDVSNSKTKSKFYKLIREHQIHICRDDFCKKNLIFDVQICRKKFSTFFFATIHRVDDDLRYIYKKTKKKIVEFLFTTQSYSWFEKHTSMFNIVFLMIYFFMLINTWQNRNLKNCMTKMTTFKTWNHTF